VVRVCSVSFCLQGDQSIEGKRDGGGIFDLQPQPCKVGAGKEVRKQILIPTY
jgi:hypothetical protein